LTGGAREFRNDPTARRTIVQRITSRNNPRLRDAARLVASSRDRRKAGRCVLEGEHVVAVYAARYGAPDTLIVTDEALARPAVRALAERHGGVSLIVPAALFADMATLPAGVGVLAVAATPDAGIPEPADFCLLLDDVQDPGNVGSMLRSAAAAGVARVLLSKRCAFAWSPKVLRAGQGAHFCVAIHEDVDLPAWARAYRATGGAVVATAAAGGTRLYEAALGGRVALGVGNEGAGLSPQLFAEATQIVTIPMHGGVESLNAAAAAAVFLFECARQRVQLPGRSRG
jgi:TrmH family RNA methyltransferase